MTQRDIYVVSPPGSPGPTDATREVSPMSSPGQVTAVHEVSPVGCRREANDFIYEVTFIRVGDRPAFLVSYTPTWSTPYAVTKIYMLRKNKTIAVDDGSNYRPGSRITRFNPSQFSTKMEGGRNVESREFLRLCDKYSEYSDEKWASEICKELHPGFCKDDERCCVVQ